MPQHRQFLMMGLPETGKTTFLAALWHVVNSPDEAPGALRLSRLEGNDEYLNGIRERWLQYKEVGRTPTSFNELASMELEGLATETAVKVVFPDLSGELFRQQVEERQCGPDYLSRVEQAAGVLLFIHSGHIKRPARIADVDELARFINREPAPQGNEGAGKTTQWEPSFVPTQTQVVELLQFCLMASDVATPLRAAIILSAWDLVADRPETPAAFLEGRLPFLDQYLKANIEHFTYRVFGVSAQGGEVDTEESRNQLAEKTDVQSDRIMVCAEGDQSHDITEPIKWLGEN